MSMSKSLALVAVVATPLGLVCASCVNPQDDFNAYVARAADAQVPPSPIETAEASVVDAASLRAPDASFPSTNYAIICVSQLAQDISQAFLLAASISYTASGKGGGTMTYSSQWLPAGATSVNDNPQKVGEITGKMTTVDATGFAKLMIGSDTIPGVSDSIQPSQSADLENLEIDFHIESPTRICASLAANITAPTPATLNLGENPCLAVPAAQSWSQLQTADIHCP
jgi:hypothetical protein